MGNNSSVAAKRRKKYVNFIRRKRDRRQHVQKHFIEDCFECGSVTIVIEKFKTPRPKKDSLELVSLLRWTQIESKVNAQNA